MNGISEIRMLMWCLSRPAIPHSIQSEIPEIALPNAWHAFETLSLFSEYFFPSGFMHQLFIRYHHWEKNCPNLKFHCPICQSHSIALLPGWWVCGLALYSGVFCSSSPPTLQQEIGLAGQQQQLTYFQDTHSTTTDSHSAASKLRMMIA